MNILVVDDEPLVLRLAEAVLRKAGHQVVTANTGEQALRLCAETPGKYEVVLSDVMMPGIDGRELAKRLKQSVRVPEVILMSGYAEMNDSVLHLTRDGMLDGCHFLKRPFTPQALAAIVAPKVRHA